METIVAALIAAAASLFIWWISRRDAQRKAAEEEARRELSESEAMKTIATLRRQNRQLADRSEELEQQNGELRRSLHRMLMSLVGRVSSEDSP